MDELDSGGECPVRVESLCGCVDECVHVCMCVYACVYVCVCLSICVYVCMCVCIVCLYVYVMYVHECVCLHVRVQAGVCLICAVMIFYGLFCSSGVESGRHMLGCQVSLGGVV